MKCSTNGGASLLEYIFLSLIEQKVFVIPSISNEHMKIYFTLFLQIEDTIIICVTKKSKKAGYYYKTAWIVRQNTHLEVKINQIVYPSSDF